MQPHAKITVAICAFEAQNTIERALHSVLTATDGPILLVDDHSSDATAKKAKEVAGERLVVVQPSTKLGIGNARQTALENIGTPYALWLDADDEILPGRPARMLQALEADADLVHDAAELIDGKSGSLIAALSMPSFLRGPGIWRQFERNWMPGLCGGFNVNFARKIGYDTSFYNSEDYDFQLRALSAGARVGLISETGYRYHHYTDTISRNLRQATSFTGQALAKHDLTSLNRGMEKDGLDKSTQSFLISCAKLQSGDAAGAIKAARQAVYGGTEPIQPYGTSAQALCHFITGSALLKLGNANEALTQFEASGLVAAECLNNMGVCHKIMGDKTKASSLFAEALALSPGYVDAVENLKNCKKPAQRITLLPLRPSAGRSDYG